MLTTKDEKDTPHGTKQWVGRTRPAFRSERSQWRNSSHILEAKPEPNGRGRLIQLEPKETDLVPLRMGALSGYRPVALMILTLVRIWLTNRALRI